MVGKVEVAGVGAGLVSRATIEATIIRADGMIEHLGVIADSGPLPAPRPSLFQLIRSKLWPKH